DAGTGLFEVDRRRVRELRDLAERGEPVVAGALAVVVVTACQHQPADIAETSRRVGRTAEIVVGEVRQRLDVHVLAGRLTGRAPDGRHRVWRREPVVDLV